MTELKRPETGVNLESIKPKFKEITEFYTQKVADYQYCLKQLNEYADALENEISVLKETPKIEILLDDMAKPLVVVPQIVADYIETQKGNNYNGNASLIVKHYDSFKDDGNDSELNIWIANNFNDFLKAIVNGYTVEKEQLYYLKNKITNQYINMNPYNGHCHESMTFGNCYKCVFTQSEIDDMETGSYERIEVEP